MIRWGTVVVSIVLSGCAGFGQVESVSDLSTDQLQALHKVEVYDTKEEGTYTSIGRVKGLSCKGSPFSAQPTREAAMTQLKIKTVKAGGNAILVPTCSHDSSVDWGNNCWDSWVCVGEAVRTKP